LRLGLGISLVLGCWNLVFSSDWPNFLGPQHNGISEETNLLSSWPTNGPPLLWQKQIGTGYSAPSVAGERLVIHHREGDEEIVQCLDARTGSPLWRYGYPTQFIDPYGYNNGPRSTPLLVNGRCYTFGAEGKIVCLDLETGKKTWERNTAAEWDIAPAFFGVGSSPILENGLLVFMVGGQPNSGVVALDPATGKTVWQNVGQTNWEGQTKIGWGGEPKVEWNLNDKQASYSTPVAATIHGQRQLFCFMRQGLVSVNPTNGAVNFSYWFRSRVEESVNAMDPVVLDDTILLSAAYYHIGSVLLRVKPNGKAVDSIWRLPVLEIHWTTPILHEGFLYAFSGRNEPDAHFRCVEMKTGKLMWDRDESWRSHSTATPPVYGRGSCILADGKLIVLGEGGLLGLFRVNPNQPQEISRFQVPQLHYPCWAAPVLSNGRLYLRSEDRLVCFDVVEKRK
jgi:outer membrane protein assembly factor BamB